MNTSTIPINIPRCFAGLVHISINAQRPMRRVVRWKSHLEHNPKLRKQSTLEHAFSFDVFVSIACSLLEKAGAKLDYRLLQSATTFHDLGEGLRGRDIDYLSKTQNHDVEEYEVFCDQISGFDSDIQEDLKRSFLLQFVTSEESIPEEYSQEARDILRVLYHNRFREAIIFKGLEAFDYLFYGIEHLMTHQNPENLVWVLRVQFIRLNSFAELVPVFGEVIWTPERRAWCADFLEKHSHLPDRPF